MNKKIIVIFILIMICLQLFVIGKPSDFDDVFFKYIKKKDIYAILIGSIISNLFNSNISSISENIIIPYLSILFNIDLTKPIVINKIKIKTKEIIKSLINLLLGSSLIVFILICYQ